ncbi:MAG: glycosyltransferase family 4 protein [Fluviicola sp.]|nr:glycosyltransferase family 4 protein [Fluviicola sp.]
MKLAYFCSSISWGGLEMNHLRDAKWMQERGHEVLIFCVSNSPLEKGAKERKLPIINIEKQKKYYDFKKAKVLVALLKENEITHFIIRSNEDMSIMATVKSMLKSKIHTSYFMAMQLGVKKTNPLHTLRYRFLDLWIPPLNWLKKQVQEMTNFKNKLVVIPSALDLSVFKSEKTKGELRTKLGIPQNVLTFGIIGRFDEQKGQLLLLEAMKKCSAKNFNVVLLGEPTINEGEIYFDQMKRIIEQEEFKNRVFIKSYREDTLTFFKSIDWMVMATKAETFGMVTIESLASGTPVLGSAAGGTPELLAKKKGGLLFETQNAVDLAKKIDEICIQNIHYDSSDLMKIAVVYDHHLICEKVEKALNLK